MVEGKDYVVRGQEMSKKKEEILADICVGFSQRRGHNKKWEEMGA